jgi:nucleoside-diphosphate-sugar epimerase
MSPVNVFLTGAGGFVGSALLPALKQNGFRVCALFRKHTSVSRNCAKIADRVCRVDDLAGETVPGTDLENIDVVIHLAGRAHTSLKKIRLTDRCSDPMVRINYGGTLSLALRAAEKGVRRFVFVSTASVYHPTEDPHAAAFTEDDPVIPYSTYTLSKLKAEQALRRIHDRTGMEVVILRPPLVYGPGVKANFLKLLKLVHTGLPLPFSAIANQRSFIFIDNLVDAIIACANHQRAGSHTFLVADSHPLSTPELVRKIAVAMSMTPRMVDFPAPVMKRALTLAGKQGIYERIWESLVVDTAKIRRCLGWQPGVLVDQGILRTVQWYLSALKR